MCIDWHRKRSAIYYEVEKNRLWNNTYAMMQFCFLNDIFRHIKNIWMGIQKTWNSDYFWMEGSWFSYLFPSFFFFLSEHVFLLQAEKQEERVCLKKRMRGCKSDKSECSCISSILEGAKGSAWKPRTNQWPPTLASGHTAVAPSPPPSAPPPLSKVTKIEGVGLLAWEIMRLQMELDWANTLLFTSFHSLIFPFLFFFFPAMFPIRWALNEFTKVL